MADKEEMSEPSPEEGAPEEPEAAAAEEPAGPDGARLISVNQRAFADDWPPSGGRQAA
jgi:hypothetical protein